MLMQHHALRLCVIVLAAAVSAAASFAAPPPPLVGEVVAVRSKDGLATSDPAARIVPRGSQPDVLLIQRATPSRNGPDAGAILCYSLALTGAPDGAADTAGTRLVRSISVDQGRSWSDAEPVVINGWPKDLEGRTPAAPSAVQLPDNRVRLYFTAVGDGAHQPDRQDKNQPPPGRVYSAISNDGKSFAIEDGVRYELAGLSSPDVIRLPDPPADDTRKIGPWLMFLTRDGSTLLATSRDGLAWSRDETFVWTSAHEASAILAADSGREVRLYGCDRTGVVSVRFDPSTGDLHADRGTRWGPDHADPAAAHCGDGALLLVCVRESTDKPDRPRREPPAFPPPDRPVVPPAWPGIPK